MSELRPAPPVQIGDKIRFTPAAWTDACGQDTNRVRTDRMEIDVTGVVDYINSFGRFYRVRYEIGGTVQHESFKF